jgi:hypothetical protein
MLIAHTNTNCSTLLAIVLSVLLRLMDSDYLFGIFKLFLQWAMFLGVVVGFSLQGKHFRACQLSPRIPFSKGAVMVVIAW